MLSSAIIIVSVNYKFKSSILGGTFDRFHLGHKKLIDEALKNSEKVTIGIASESLYKNKYLSNIIESYKTRLRSVEKYILSKYGTDRVEFIEINDIFGNSLTTQNIDAIFVTEDTYKNAELINSKRLELKLRPLEIVKVDFALSPDKKKITSDRIRKGEIDRNGLIYLELFLKQKRFILHDEDRDRFKKPIGKIVKNLKGIEKVIKNKTLTAAIGDIITIKLDEAGIFPDLSIIDHKTRRLEINNEQKDILSRIQKSRNILNADNSAGSIERRAVGVIHKAITSFLDSKIKQLILIQGEEDLLVLPVILLLPLESVVLYGQPDKGIVVVTVTEKKKKEAAYLFSILS